MFVYIDESGNTGKNIADKNNPNFYHMAIMSRYNIDLDLQGAFTKILKNYNLEEFHAVKNFNIVEDIAPILLDILKRNKVQFFFSQIEKTYVAYAKLFNSLFDHIENIGARGQVYNIRVLRLTMLCNLISIVDESTATDFYMNCLMSNSKQQALDYLRRTCKKILAKIDNLPDLRSKQIITDTVKGALFAPENLTLFEESKEDKLLHFPYVISFLPMLSCISKYSKKNKTSVFKILHDQQNQVHDFIYKLYDIAAKTPNDGIWDLAEDGYFDFKNITPNLFEMKNSEESYGIQLTDCCLSVLIKFLSKSYIGPNTLILAKYIVQHIYPFIFTKDILFVETAKLNKIIYNMNISEDQIKNAMLKINNWDKAFYSKLESFKAQHNIWE